MVSPAPRVGYVRMGPHPIPNRLLADALALAMPEARISVLDLEPLLRRNRLAMATNAAWVAAEHGPNLVRRLVTPWQAFFTTTHAFRRMSRLARTWVQENRFDWTLQIQSLFDARAPGVPHFVYTDHTHLANLGYPDFDPRALRSPRWIALERALYRGAHGVFARSTHIQDSLTGDYGVEPARTHRVGAGANALVPDTAPSAPGPGAKTGREILFVGVDWERKGGPELVRAFTRVRARIPEATLTVVGCTPDLDAPGVRVLGRVPVEEVHRHFERADLFCLPTRREPFGVVFVEALHHGLPIVATRVGALPDLVTHGENGFLVQVGDEEGLAEHLATLLADAELRRRQGEAGRRRALEQYTWKVVTRRMLEAIEAATSSAPSATPDADLGHSPEPVYARDAASAGGPAGGKPAQE